ncbi:MAG: metalloregulator ArsR/SmtB family transcription factor [Haliea sp.]|uniref:ArsR/SmtB family transcription factor n=1 Tax=Haliea sp. TaxID=1932666 RepID=UPI0032EF39B1
MIDADAMALRAAEAALLLKQLANEKRLMILCALVEGERTVGALNAAVPLSQSALSQHLARLREAGLVTTRRDGQLIYYALAGVEVLAVLQLLHTLYCAD